MDIFYFFNLNVKLKRGDLDRIFKGDTLSGRAFGVYPKKFIEVNVFSSDEVFSSGGGLAEGFEQDSFQAWVLERPREQIQLAFPWGNEEVYRDYSTLDIKISKPVLVRLIEDRKGVGGDGDYFCGMARGCHSGHVIDRLNLQIYLAQ